jgi:hypothetical protein
LESRNPGFIPDGSKRFYSYPERLSVSVDNLAIYAIFAGSYVTEVQVAGA